MVGLTTGTKFAAFEEVEKVIDRLDDLTPAQRAQAITLFASKYEMTVVASYKPSKGCAPRRKRSV